MVQRLTPFAVPLALLAAACGGGGSAPGEPGQGASQPRSGLLITLDTTRYDALGCLGGPPGVSPHLDALAREGLIYSQARTVSPLTMPSHATILTGLTPLRHTVHTNSQLALPASAETLAERATAHGLTTAAFVAAVVLDAGFGLHQGFEVYDQPVAPEVQAELHYDRRRAREVGDAAVAWIEGLDAERRFFLWVHFFDPHLPYDPPAEFVEQAGGPGYHAEVAAMDAAIGRIFAALRERGLYDQTLIAVVADHGEGLGDHGEDTHGTLAYDSTIRVPFFLRYPDGHRAGDRSSEVVSVTDVFPTFVEGLGLGAASDIDGISLYRRAVPDDRGIYFESLYGHFSFGWSPLVGWADARGKYLHSSQPEFYVPTEDAAEAHDRIDGLEPDFLGSYTAAIAELGRRPRLVRTMGDAAGAEALSGLQNLGYTGAGPGAAEAGPSDPLATEGRPSPAAMREAYAEFRLAQELNVHGRPREAIPLLERVLEVNPQNAEAWFQLGGARLQVGDLDGSLEASRQALAVGRPWYGPHRNLALAYERLERPADALASYRAALELGPPAVDLLQRAIELCTELGKDDEADGLRLELLRLRGGG